MRIWNVCVSNTKNTPQLILPIYFIRCNRCVLDVKWSPIDFNQINDIDFDFYHYNKVGGGRIPKAEAMYQSILAWDKRYDQGN